MNTVYLVGNISHYVELMEFPARDGGQPKTRVSFGLAADRPVMGGGEDFIHIVAWDVKARNLVRLSGS